MAFSRYAHGRHPHQGSSSKASESGCGPSTSSDELVFSNTSSHLLSVKHERRMGKIKTKWIPQRLSFSNNTIPSLHSATLYEHCPVVVEEKESDDREDVEHDQAQSKDDKSSKAALHLSPSPMEMTLTQHGKFEQEGQMGQVEKADSIADVISELKEQDRSNVANEKEMKGTTDTIDKREKPWLHVETADNKGGLQKLPVGGKHTGEILRQEVGMGQQHRMGAQGQRQEVRGEHQQQQQQLQVERQQQQLQVERQQPRHLQVERQQPRQLQVERQQPPQLQVERQQPPQPQVGHQQPRGAHQQQLEEPDQPRVERQQQPPMPQERQRGGGGQQREGHLAFSAVPDVHQTRKDRVVTAAPTPFDDMSTQRLSVNGKPYCLLKEIGRGGSSLVYEALDSDKNLFAIKVVDLSKVDAVEAEAFKNEVVLLQKLQVLRLKRVIKMYDFEIVRREKNARYFDDEDDFEEQMLVVMERGDVNLASLLKKKVKEGGVTDLERQFYWSEMLQAVQEIHNEGVIHSDLKPANFLIVHGTLKLIDFGIASAVNPDKTSVEKSSIMGTINFMAPEAISNIARTNNEASKYKISVKSDVWSLGCILYFLTFYRLPFDELKHPLQKVQAIMNDEHPIPMPKTNNNQLLIDVITKCLVREPKKRASVGELLKHPYLEQGKNNNNSGSTEDKKLDSNHLLSKLNSVLTPNSKLVLTRALDKLKETHDELN